MQKLGLYMFSTLLTLPPHPPIVSLIALMIIFRAFHDMSRQYVEIVHDPHDAMRCFMWQMDQKSVCTCALVLAIVKEAQTS